MIDNLSILISTLACLFVIWRAARLDRSLPWFPAPQPAAEKPAPMPSEPVWIPDWEIDPPEIPGR